MNNNESEIELDYKKLYLDLKEKYEKLKEEAEELRIENNIKNKELNNLKKNSKENIIRLNFNSFDKKDFSNLKNEDNIIPEYKNNSKKYETYSVDSFRNEIEQGNDLLNELMKTDIDEIKLHNFKSLIKIENKDNFQILSNKKNLKVLVDDIDSILISIKKKQESLYQTQKMLNLKIDDKF